MINTINLLIKIQNIIINGTYSNASRNNDKSNSKMLLVGLFK